MRSRSTGRSAFWLPSRVASVVVLLAVAAAAQAEELVTVRPQDTGEVLTNPAMGWVFHHYDNDIGGYGAPLGPGYSGGDFPGLTVCYLRLPWSYLEPEEGRFNWSVFDTVAQRYITAGHQVALRLTCCESGLKYATPEWVRKAGAKGYEWEGGKLWEPNYDDPIYLQKLERFLAAAGARYDGNPHVAYVDIGTIGVWGEGHPINGKYGFATIKRHIDLHRKYFPHTLLAAMDDWIRWFGGFDLRKPGRLPLPISFQIPDGCAGQTFDVKAGLWLPRNTTLPEGRLLPVGGGPDRRVLLGRLTVSPEGVPTFAPATAATGGGGADYRLQATKLSRLGSHWRLGTVWDILRPLPEGTTPFCHFDHGGQIVFAGWADAVDTKPVDYARSLGCTLRDDSILVEATPNAYYSDWLAQDFWPQHPVVLETAHYGSARDGKAWGDGSEFLNAVEAYHASYASIHAVPRELLSENRELIARINRRLGYRLNLVEATLPTVVDPREPLRIATTWRNSGVAPCYPGGYVAFSLFSARGELIATLVDEGRNLRDLPVGAPGAAEPIRREVSLLLPPGMTPGSVDVRVSVGDRLGTPQIALPLPGDDGHRRYSIAKVRVRGVPGEYGVEVGPMTQEGDTVRLGLTWTVRTPLPGGTRPFCHLASDGEAILFQGDASEVQGDITKPGNVGGSARITIPPQYRGKTLAVKVGLWRQGDLRPDGRMLPDSAEADRRVTLGDLRIAADGRAAFVPAP